MRKILHVTESLGGGVVQSIATICWSLSGTADLYVLHSRRPETPDKPSVLYPPEVTFIDWAAEREVSLFNDWRSVRDLKKVVAEIDPDVIHAHSSKAGALVRLAFPLSKRPAICYSPRGYSFLRPDISAPARVLYHAIEWFLGRTRSLTVAGGLSEYRHALRHARHATYISNAVPLPDAKRSDRDTMRELVVVSSGRIAPQKNFPLFVEVAEHLQSERVRFKWIGGGEISGSLELPSNMEITGWLGRQDALDHLADADLYVHTAHFEGLSIAIIEAMMIGLPVLAKPGSGTTELIVEGYSGYLCENADEFTARIRECIAKPESLAELGSNGSRIAAEDYSVNTVAPRWRSLYQFFDRYRTYG